MSSPLQPTISGSFRLALIAIALMHTAAAQERSASQLLEALTADVRTASAAEIRVAKSQTAEALNRLQTELADQAIGVVLSEELQLTLLASELSKELPDVQQLRSIVRALRRILPGKVQRSTDELRARLANLARLLSLTPSGVEIVRQSIVTIGAHFQDVRLRQTRDGERELRQAFAELQTYHPSTADIELLRKQLSIANYSSLIKREFITTVSQRSFELPVTFRECKDGTAIAGDGKIRVALALELPLSRGESQLLVRATGAGQIGVAADRQRIHVCAQLLPHVQGQQLLHIRPSEISGDSPAITAQLRTQLTQVNIDGLLGRLKLSERLAAHFIQSRLDAAERPVEIQIERTAKERVEEESYDIAYRINGLLRQGLWDRIRSLDYQPDVQLQNDMEGIRTSTHVVNGKQLGALSKQPEIPPDRQQALDLITWVHESSANNIFDSFTGIRMDEATVRGVWETELKLTSDDWKSLPPARIPAVITLADQSPLELRFVPQGIEVRLRVTSCEVDGQIEDEGAREFAMAYRLENDSQGIRLSRQSLVFTSDLSPEKQAIWNKTIDLFFGNTLRPAPKFRNSSFSEFLRLGYLHLSEGWLVIGATRTLPANAASTQSPEEVLR